MAKLIIIIHTRTEATKVSDFHRGTYTKFYHFPLLSSDPMKRASNEKSLVSSLPINLVMVGLVFKALSISDPVIFGTTVELQVVLDL